MQVETRSRSAAYPTTPCFVGAPCPSTSLHAYCPQVFSGARTSCPTCNHTNIFRCGAATSAEQACARAVPFSGLLAKGIKNRIAVPIILRRVVCFARVGINKDRFVCDFFSFADQW